MFVKTEFGVVGARSSKFSLSVWLPGLWHVGKWQRHLLCGMFERCNRSAGSQSCALARFVACLKQAVQASSMCKSTERGQKQETVSSPASCSGSFCRRLHHRSTPVAAPCPRGAVVRRCPGASRSHPIPDPGRSVGPGFLARARGRNETET